MARDEQEREDLLREAVALVERCELALASGGNVVLGFRADGAASFYFDGDPAWHFNARRQLRRAFVDGFLYKAERGRLVRLERSRTATAVELLRHACSQQEMAKLLARAGADLVGLQQALMTGEYQLVGQVPPGADVGARAAQWLAAFSRPIRVAATPRV